MKYGEYIRTRKKGIFKVVSIETTVYGYVIGTTNSDIIPTFTIGKGGHAEIKNDIINHSKDPKDLVQAGDLIYYTIKGLEHSTYIDIVSEHTDARTLEKTLRVRIYKLEQLNIKKILTKGQINENIFEVVE